MSNRFKASHETSYCVSVYSWMLLLLCTLVLIRRLCVSVESAKGCAAWHCVWEPERSWHVEHVWSCWRWSMTGHMFEYPGCSGRAARPWVPPLGLQLVWLLCFLCLLEMKSLFCFNLACTEERGKSGVKECWKNERAGMGAPRVTNNRGMKYELENCYARLPALSKLITQTEISAVEVGHTSFIEASWSAQHRSPIKPCCLGLKQ